MKISTRQDERKEDAATRKHISAATMAEAASNFYDPSDPNNETNPFSHQEDDDMDEVCSVVSSITAGTFASSSLFGEQQHDFVSMNTA